MLSKARVVKGNQERAVFTSIHIFKLSIALGALYSRCDTMWCDGRRIAINEEFSAFDLFINIYLKKEIFGKMLSLLSCFELISP